jgi:peptidoglycan/xylan/chitin deacetylase (PgdA/CDA1 family)
MKEPIVSETLFVFTNDDPGGQEPELFAELLDFLAGQEVPATFFVIPAAGGKELDTKPRWLELLQRALDEGHELQHHGLVHTAFEFGVPPYFMLDIMPDSKAQWQRDPASFSAQHTQAILADKLAQGQKIFERTLGYKPQGFRSPCLAICDNMYAALHDLGFQWSSNTVLNPMGWRYINRKYDAAPKGGAAAQHGAPWQEGLAQRPFRHPSGLIEAPIHSEYTWYLTDSDIERHFQLAKNDFDRARQAAPCCAAAPPFVALSHYYAMTGKWSAGLRVYERLFAHARKVGNVRFTTLGQLIKTGGD